MLHLVVDLSAIDLNDLRFDRRIHIEGPHCYFYVFDLFQFSNVNFIASAEVVFMRPLTSSIIGDGLNELVLTQR